MRYARTDLHSATGSAQEHRDARATRTACQAQRVLARTSFDLRPFSYFELRPFSRSILSPMCAKSIALFRPEPVLECGNAEVLVQCRGPIKNRRVTFQKALPWLKHQKLESIFRDSILIHRGIWNQSGIKQFSWDAYLRRRAALHCH
jgi:hypothetical protein